MVPISIWRAALAVLFISALGCSQEKLNELVDQGQKKLKEGADQVVEQAQAAVNDTTAQAKEKLQLSGKIEVASATPLAAAACYARFVPAHGERSAVLQLQSYRDATAESYPSIFARAIVSAESAAKLVGQTIEIQLFAQSQANGPVWFSNSDAPVHFKITAVDDQQIVGEFIDGQLQRTDSPETTAVTGGATGVWLAAQTGGA